MPGVMDLVMAAAHFQHLKHEMDEIEEGIIRKACEMVCAEARRVLGEGYPEWPALSPATIAQKIGPGPLLETGEMRDSIHWNAEGKVGHVGSNNDKAVWQELGTSNAAHPIPPRSFLMGAALRMQGEIHALAARAAIAVMTGGSLFGPEMQELLHLLHHAANDIKELASGVLEGGDNNNQGRH